MNYRASTQKRWHVKCKHCRLEQYLDLLNIKIAKDGHRYYGCHQCDTELDRSSGRWIATNPEGLYVGYHINQLIAPWISADKIIEKWKRAKNPMLMQYTIRGFWNEAIGVTYTGKEKPIEMKDLHRCLDPKRALGASRGTGPIVLSGDWGNHTRWALWQMTRRGQVLLLDTGIWTDKDTNKHRDKAAKLIEKHNAYGVFCGGYGKSKNQHLMEKFPARYYAVFTNDSKNHLKPVWQHDRLERHISIEHTIFCDNVINLIEGGIDSLVIPWAHCDSSRDSYDPGIHDRLKRFFGEMVKVKSADVITKHGKQKRFDVTPAHAFVTTGFALLMLQEKYKLVQKAEGENMMQKASSIKEQLKHT